MLARGAKIVVRGFIEAESLAPTEFTTKPCELAVALLLRVLANAPQEYRVIMHKAASLFFRF